MIRIAGGFSAFAAAFANNVTFVRQLQRAAINLADQMYSKP